MLLPSEHGKRPPFHKTNKNERWKSSPLLEKDVKAIKKIPVYQREGAEADIRNHSVIDSRLGDSRASTWRHSQDLCFIYPRDAPNRKESKIIGISGGQNRTDGGDDINLCFNKASRIF